MSDARRCLSTTVVLILGAVLFAVAPDASRAETDIGTGGHLAGDLELGYRWIHGDYGSAYFQRYQDYRPGLIQGMDLLLDDASRRKYLELDGSYVGETDQYYHLGLGERGVWGLDLEFLEMPHVWTNDGRTLYLTPDRQTFILPAGTTGRIQTPIAFPASACGAFGYPSGTAAQLTDCRRALTLGAVLAGSQPVDLEYTYRKIGASGFLNFTDDLQGRAGWSMQTRKGTVPLGISWGTPGNNFSSFAAPKDDSDNQPSGGLTYQQRNWSVSLDYNGSYYNNDVNSLTVQNFLGGVVQQGSAGPPIGTLSTAPRNHMNQFSLSGGWSLPFEEMPTRLTGVLSYGRRGQDSSFLPFTSNPLLSVPFGLPEDNLDGKVDTMLANFNLVSRLTRDLQFKAGYRYYNYDNKTDSVVWPGEVESDRLVVTGDEKNPVYSYRRQTATADLAYSFAKPATIHVGVDWEHWGRKDNRPVTNLSSYTPKVAFELNPHTWWTWRLGYAATWRNASQYDEQIAPGEPSGLREFDLASGRFQKAYSRMQFTPCETFEAGLNAGWRSFNYNATYGLDHQSDWSAGVDFSWRPIERVGFNAGYDYEMIEYSQNSIYRNVVGTTVITDTINNWRGTFLDRAQNLNLGMDLNVLPGKLDFSVNYGLQFSNNKTNASGPSDPTNPNTNLRGSGANDWPWDNNTIQDLTTTLTYRATEHLSFRGGYRWEKFNYRSFATDGLAPWMPLSNSNARTAAGLATGSPFAPTSDVFMPVGVGDYNVHIFGLSAVYSF